MVHVAVISCTLRRAEDPQNWRIAQRLQGSMSSTFRSVTSRKAGVSAPCPMLFLKKLPPLNFGRPINSLKGTYRRPERQRRKTLPPPHGDMSHMSRRALMRQYADKDVREVPDNELAAGFCLYSSCERSQRGDKIPYRYWAAGLRPRGPGWEPAQRVEHDGRYFVFMEKLHQPWKLTDVFFVTVHITLNPS